MFFYLPVGFSSHPPRFSSSPCCFTVGPCAVPTPSTLVDCCLQEFLAAAHCELVRYGGAWRFLWSASRRGTLICLLSLVSTCSARANGRAVGDTHYRCAAGLGMYTIICAGVLGLYTVVPQESCTLKYQLLCMHRGESGLKLRVIVVPTGEFCQKVCVPQHTALEARLTPHRVPLTRHADLSAIEGQRSFLW